MRIKTGTCITGGKIKVHMILKRASINVRRSLLNEMMENMIKDIKKMKNKVNG